MNISGLDENVREFFIKASSMASFEFKINMYLIVQEIKNGILVNTFNDFHFAKVFILKSRIPFLGLKICFYPLCLSSNVLPTKVNA